MKPLKVAFLVDHLDVTSYDYDVIRHVCNNDNFDLPVIITGYNKSNSPKSSFLRIFHKIKASGLLATLRLSIFVTLYRLIEKIELKNVHLTRPEYRSYKSILDLKDVDVLAVDGNWSTSGLYLSFSSHEIRIIREREIDVIVRCGSGILRGDILTAAKYGVLSFHHGDNRTNRGGPSGFWEVLLGEPSSGFIIQRLNSELDGGDIICRGNIMTSHGWLLNNANLLAKSNIFFIRVLDQLAILRALPAEEQPILHDRPLYRLNYDPFLLMKYLLFIHGPRIARALNRILYFRRNEVNRWSIAYSINDGLKRSLWRYKEISNPPNRFLADPFIWTKDGRSIIFVEDFCYFENKANISAIDITDGYEVFLGNVLVEEFHLSFPFIFEESGILYMIPESHQANQIRLYECLDFPLKWRFKKVIMNDVSAADSMLIKKNDCWFLLTNICSASIGDHQSELHIFYASDLFANEWMPLSQGNPVIFDSRRARNGGIFTHCGIIYRVNQVHGKAHYGHSFSINKIVNIDQHYYSEEPVDHITPSFKNGITSTHHFSSNEYYSVVDFCRKALID